MLKLFEDGWRKIDPHCSGKYFCLFFKNYFFPGAEILVVEMCDAGKASAATGEKATLRHWEPPKPSNGHRQVAPSNAFSHKTDTNGLLRATNLHTNLETKEISASGLEFSQNCQKKSSLWDSICLRGSRSRLFAF